MCVCVFVVDTISRSVCELCGGRAGRGQVVFRRVIVMVD